MNLGKYQHYKGNFYEVIGVARHSETFEDLVIYRAIEGDNEMWARPMDMFLEKVVINDEVLLRFRFIE